MPSSTDLRIAIRTLLRQRVFTTVAVASLGLAIALNATMYSVLDELIAPRVDIRDPAKLYAISYYGNMRHKLAQATIDSTLLTGMRGYESFARESFGGIFTAESGPRYRDVWGGLVDTTYFRLLGVHPKEGRIFGGADLFATQPVTIISARLAQALFPDQSAVGRTIVVDVGQRFSNNNFASVAPGTYTVVGVLNPESQITGRDMYTLPPASDIPKLAVSIVRLKDKVPKERVEADLAVLAARLADEAGESHKDTRFYIRQAIDHQFTLHAFHIALISAVLAVLLVACANLANLQLARGISRARELAVRVAVGAGRRDLIAHLLLESAVLTSAGLILGLLLTLWGVHLVHATMPPRVASLVTDPHMNWHVVVVAVLASALCALLIGLLPAIRVSRVDPNDLLKAGAGTGAMKRNRRQYGALVVVEIGLALALLSGASIVVRTAWRLDEVRFSFDPRVIAEGTFTTAVANGSVIHRDVLATNLVNRVRANPDIADAATFSYANAQDSVTVDDASGMPHQVPAPLYGYRKVTPSYLRTFNRPIIAGRDFREGERDAPVAVVDELTARFLFGAPDKAIGHLIKMGPARSTLPYMRIVGVAANVMDLSSIDQTRAQGGLTRLGEVLVNYTAADSSVSDGRVMRPTVIARARRDPAALPLTLRHILRDLTRGPVSAANEEDVLGITTSRQQHHFVAALFAVFAFLGVTLAALGVYAIVAHGVAERRRELGVRIALGASRRDVLHAVLREGNVLALAGIALGLYLTKSRVPLLQQFALENDQYDALLFAEVAVVLFVVALVAAFVPANRATRIDPVEAMRAE